LKHTFYSNGKLLITAEYLVLDGAIALALPTKFGQNLVVEKGNKNQISWKSYDADNSIWFDQIISFEEITSKKQEQSNPIKTTLIQILHEGFLMNPDFISKSEGYQVTTNLTFSRNWGLGTSSTLINNIAQWLQIDAFKLLNNSFGGSGYDIACAQNNSGILYQLINGKPVVKTIDFNPCFKSTIFFVYLNQKQNSKLAIENYRKNKSNLTDSILQINAITNLIVMDDNITSFISNLEEHEDILSCTLETKTIKEQLFPDFDGTIKSLGAWGGDFVMVVSKKNPSDYFKSKGFDVVLSFDEMIL
jgi:mevalonate kinase